MADKPSRALVVYGYGLAPSIKPSHSHIHTVASRGCCGFLALDNLPASGSEDERLVREFAKLCDAHEAYGDAYGGKALMSEHPEKVTTISERFMGMKAAMVTDSSAVKCFGEKLGFIAVELDNLKNDEPSMGLAASELLKLLGFENGKALETNQFDLVFVHIGPHAEYMNNLVGQILQNVQPGSEIGSRLHFSLLASYGTALEDNPNISLLCAHERNNSDISVIYPLQSYTMKGGKPRTDIRHQCPMLVAQWQDAVTRKDMVEVFSFNDFRKHSGNLAIPADRFLYEIAFKLWKAPKYGA
ncbi:hypothetical protein Ancab_023021 [Ancistrocladus abbreviatus]